MFLVLHWSVQVAVVIIIIKKYYCFDNHDCFDDEGKSTCVGIIERFYPIMAGKVLIDEQPIGNVIIFDLWVY